MILMVHISNITFVTTIKNWVNEFHLLIGILFIDEFCVEQPWGEDEDSDINEGAVLF